MIPRNLERLPEVLFEIGKAIGADKGLQYLFDTISALVCDLLDADACSVMLIDSSRTVLLGKAASGLEAGRIQEISFRVGQGVAGWVAETGEAALIRDCADDARFIMFADAATRIRSMACVPIIASIGDGGVSGVGDTAGVMTATSSRLDAFGAAELELLRFVARTIALDIENMRLRKVSVTDPLTGAYNREFLHTRLPAELTAARHRGVALSVAMVDVDHFKPINDRFGHAVGDVVLAQVAERLRGATRKGDVLVRYGGEEFLVVLPDADLDRAGDVGERMRLALQAEPIETGTGATLEVRISAGVAALGLDDDATSLIRRADTALYRAKGRGRNRVEIAT
ncbi:MAG TPA: sensor domain-containing diguanylate cyclase [Kofleriaceae bacterium]|nr:sensor domain-containing diguanylate cyclase [Kofleriaceae bacterium]